MIPSSATHLKSASGRSLSPSREAFDASWQPVFSVLLGLSRVAGANSCEFFLERRNHVSLLVENGKVTSVSPSLSLGGGVRVFRGTTDCYVSTHDVSYAGLKWALDKALSILGLSTPDGSRLLPEVNLEPLRDYGALRSKNAWLGQCPNIAESAEALMRVNAAVAKQTAHLESAMTSTFRDWQEVLVASSDGIFARDVRLTQSFVAQVSCVDGAHRASLGERRGDSANPKFLFTLPEEEIVSSLAHSAGAMLRADFVQSGKFPIVMANRFGGVIFHEACGHLLETTQVEKKTTPFLDSMGELIANEAVTAWDEGVTENAFGTLDMDDEGMPAQRTLLIENGRLRNFISDRTGQMRTGHPRTGSGRRQNYTFAAASRMRNTYIAGGKSTPDELIASMDRGLYCKRMGGGSVGATGEFNFGVSEAYLVEKGKITKPVKGATLIGDAKDILMQISMCANDTELAPGFCGSVSGSIYVTVGQPHIKVDAITVGGR
ncbi:MAG: TldD/PmbA family protein [Silvanigrellales bacterium]|nr:TldD/PmbA family protein [Silvanigrellales bacterium]